MSTNLHDNEDLLRARAEGKDEGMAEGRKAGHELGLAEGRAIGMKEGHETGLAEGMKAGADAERDRIKAILNHPEANGREASANHLALNTTMSVEDAAGVLAGVAKSSSISSRAAETVSFAAVAAEGVSKDVPNQKGAAAWDDIANQINAEFGRRAGAAR